MGIIKLKSYAKINLCLDIVNKRPDGYHNINTIMQTLDLSDNLEIEMDEDIQIECRHPFVPEDQRNIAYKAAYAIINKAGIKGGARIKISKRIPVAAGLAGGSSNAAAVLHGINILYNIGYTVSQLIDIGKRIGADVPFCLVGGTVLAEGIGDRLSLLTPLKEYNIVLVKPDFGISTKEVYQRVELKNLRSRPDVKQAVFSIENKDLPGLVKAMGNVLEPITGEMVPEVFKIKQKMLELGAEGSQMCGSGPTVYGICSSRDKAFNIYKYFKSVYTQVFLCKTI